MTLYVLYWPNVLIQAEDFYGEHREKDFFNELVNYISSGPVLAMELRRADAVREWRRLLGPTDASKAKDTDPQVGFPSSDGS